MAVWNEKLTTCFDCGKQAVEPALLGCCESLMCSRCIENRVDKHCDCLFCGQELQPECVEVLQNDASWITEQPTVEAKCAFGCGPINRYRPWIHYTFCQRKQSATAYSRTVLPASVEDVRAHVAEIRRLEAKVAVNQFPSLRKRRTTFKKLAKYYAKRDYHLACSTKVFL